jgi:hypothetical protein
MPTEPHEVTDAGSGRPRGRNGWGLLLFSVMLGAVMWAAAWIGGHPELGLVMFVIMAACEPPPPPAWPSSRR